MAFYLSDLLVTMSGMARNQNFYPGYCFYISNHNNLQKKRALISKLSPNK